MKIIKILLGSLLVLLLVLLLLNVVVERNVQTEIVINAESSQVWSQFMDHAEYPNWNPFIKSIEGSTEVGSQLKANIQLPGQDAMVFEPEVLVNEVNKEFRWLGNAGMPGIFDGEHYFLLEDLGDGTTKFTQGENFSGLLSGLGMLAIYDDTEAGFKMMNEALKERAE